MALLVIMSVKNKAAKNCRLNESQVSKVYRNSKDSEKQYYGRKGYTSLYDNRRFWLFADTSAGVNDSEVHYSFLQTSK